MLNVVSLLWDHNDQSQWFSRCYDEIWAVRLRDGFRRHLSIPHRFILFVDHRRDLPKDIIQVLLTTAKPNWHHCIEPFRLGEPMILCGLDTVVTGDCDHLGHYCLRGATILLPRDPYHPERACNGVCLVPVGFQSVWENWNGENDMEWMRKQPHSFIDDTYPGRVQSYKGHVKEKGLGNTRIVYFHGDEKPHQLTDVPWIQEHWLGNAA